MNTIYTHLFLYLQAPYGTKVSLKQGQIRRPRPFFALFLGNVIEFVCRHKRHQGWHDLISFGYHGQTVGDTNKCGNRSLVGNIFHNVVTQNVFRYNGTSSTKNSFLWFTSTRLEIGESYNKFFLIFGHPPPIHPA